jgi:hypothetical protein
MGNIDDRKVLLVDADSWGSTVSGAKWLKLTSRDCAEPDGSQAVRRRFKVAIGW